MPFPINEKLIQRQINHWNGLRKYLGDQTQDEPADRRPVITVSRLAGSGGRQIAEALAERLNLPLHDRSIVERVMRDENLPPGLAAELDEQVATQSSLWIKGLFNHRIFLVREYHFALERAINALAAADGGVFLGRGANHVLGARADLRIRVVANFEHRLDQLRREDTSRAEARAVLHEIDDTRAEFIKRVYGAESGLPCHYDLTINTDRITVPAAVELALLALLTRADGRANPLVLAAHNGS